MQFTVDVSMGAPLIEDKRWSIDLEKRIQEEHYSDSKLYNERYAFNPKSGKEIFVVDTPLYSSESVRYSLSKSQESPTLAAVSLIAWVYSSMAVSYTHLTLPTKA